LSCSGCCPSRERPFGRSVQSMILDDSCVMCDVRRPCSKLICLESEFQSGRPMGWAFPVLCAQRRMTVCRADFCDYTMCGSCATLVPGIVNLHTAPPLLATAGAAFVTCTLVGLESGREIYSSCHISNSCRSLRARPCAPVWRLDFVSTRVATVRLGPRHSPPDS
jgi:hypothetical protein